MNEDYTIYTNNTDESISDLSLVTSNIIDRMIEDAKKTNHVDMSLPVNKTWELFEE